MNFEENEISLAKLIYDSVKENDLKLFFEVLMVPSESRTISDLDSLVKVMMHIEPIKKMKNLSAVYYACKNMTLTKYKCKEILYQAKEQAESLYIVLNGKIAFYKKSSEYFESDEVIFLNSGACFGQLYNWNTSFMPIAVQETLVAILPQKETLKIPLQLSLERKRIFAELENTQILSHTEEMSQEKLNAMSLLTINKIPCGQFLIREGENPRALFFLSRGIVRKIFTINGNEVTSKRYSEGQYFPNNLKQPITYDLIAETLCEIITIPKKTLKIIKSPILQKLKEHQTVDFIKEQLRKKEQWVQYKNIFMTNLRKSLHTKTQLRK